MRLLGFIVFAVCMLIVLNAQPDGPFIIETRRERYGDILIVKDNTGKTVLTCYIYGSMEYQIGIPSDEEELYVCLVSRFYMAGDRMPTCFRRQSAPKDIEKRNEINLSACGDRDVIYLSPTDCEQSLGQNDTETGENRQKRDCFTRQELVNVCLQSEGYCERYGWWAGRNRCKSWNQRCIRYDARVVETTSCRS